MEARKENKMGTMPVSRLLISMSLPIMISMLVQAMYNIVDSIFVAQVSENALTAVSLAFPVQNLMIAVSVGTGVGINSLLSRRLGERNFEDANATAENGLVLAVISAALFALFGGLFSEQFFRLFTQTKEIVEMGTGYLTICTVFSFGIFLQVTAERIMQSTGNTIYNMITQGIGAITNIILDPILIFGLYGMPAMGVNGAAAATVVGQILAMVLGLLFNVLFNHDVRISFKGFRPNLRIIREIYKVGVPSIIMQSIATVMTIGMNKILIPFTETAVSVFGVYFKLQSFVFMPIFGLNNGMVPIIAYNYGAGRRDRVIKTMKLSVTYAVSIMLVGLLVMQLLPGQLLMLFNATPELLTVGVPALRTICLSFLFAGFCIVVGSVFQALGNGVYSMIVSVARQLFVLLPVAYLLSLTGKVSNIWWAFPIAELMSMALSVYFLVRIYKKIICHIGEEQRS